MNKCKYLLPVFGAISSAILLSPALHAQALEEVVVTAQRRVQSLQEVPISIEAVSGDEIRLQGFRNMDQLADFSPSILIDERIQDQDISIRGIGTTGNNLTLEQAAPTFIDGIHYGRTSQIKNAFIDLERVEVLRGPQPVYFGQNATAGAFSLVTRKPGAEWEGNITGEIGRFGRQTIEAAAGGPVTDTFGVRVAGKWDKFDGHLKDIISGDNFPARRDWAGRVIVQWAPTDQFEATAKFQFTDYDGGSDGAAVRTVAGNIPNTERRAFDGTFEGFEFIPITDSWSDRLGIRSGPRYFYMPAGYNNADANSGNVDIRGMAEEIRGDISGNEKINPWDGYLNLNYRLNNDIELTSLTGFSRLVRSYTRDNSYSPFLQNMQNRTEDYNSWSQEFRITSPAGGAVEWMTGFYWQQTDLELTSDSIRGELRRPRRLNVAWEDGEWLSAFATLTFNFMDNKASLDLGGRYTDVQKSAAVEGYSATWIFDIEPVSRSGYVAVPGGFTYPFNLQRFVPPEWNARAPVGITPLITGLREGGPHEGEFKQDRFDPQVTFRYRPTDDISTYARWARAFKAGGFNTGSGSIASTDDEFNFNSEYAENWEIGAKGSFWDGRARANLSLFWMIVDDLQIATTAIREGVAQGSTSTNAGKQRVRGAEFDITALLADRLTVGVNGALMDGKMLAYEGAGCTQAEFDEAATGPCISRAESEALYGNRSAEGLIDRSGQQAPRTPDWVFTGNIDYWMPVLNSYKATFNGKFKVSDGYITNVEDFDLIIKMNRHADMNLTVGIGDLDDVWRFSVWGRNLLQPLPSYNEEYHINPQGFLPTNLSPSHFRTYGVQLDYSF